MVGAEDALNIYQGLAAAGIRSWLTGGWGIDALLGEQTRPHKDLDLFVQLDDVLRLRALLDRGGYKLVELWSENRWMVDGQGATTATAFVLQNAAGRQVDVHALVLDAHGDGAPTWEDGFPFSAEDLAGQGVIAGTAVACISAAMQRRCHLGYTLPEKQLRDLQLLDEKFGAG